MADYGVRIILSASSPAHAYTGGIWSSGVARLSSSSGASGWTSGQIIEVSPLGEQVDIAQGGNYASIGDFDAVVLATWFPAFEAAGASLYGATVEVGTLSGTTLTVRWSGIVVDAPWKGAELRIRAESLISRRHKTIPTRVMTSQEYPGIPASAEGKPVPILYGAVTGLTGTPLVSDRQYYDDACIVYGSVGATGAAKATSIWGELGAHKGIMTHYQAPGISFAPSAGEYPSWFADIAGGNVYLEITDGTGSGQSRQVTGSTGMYSWVNPEGATIWFVALTFAAPFDPIPENLGSILRLYSQDLDGVILVGDEAVVSEVTGINDNETYPVLFVQGSNSLGVTADLSSQLASGDSIETIVYLQPSISETANVVDKDLTTLTTYANSYSGEVICPASATIDQIAPWYNQHLTGVRGFMKAETTTAHYNSSATTFRQYVSAMRISGTNDVTTLFEMPDPVDGFPPWILNGGTATNLLTSPLVVTSRDISEYARIDTDVEAHNPQHGPISEQALTSVTFTNGSSTLTMTGLAEKAPSFIAGATDLALCKIRPKGCPRGQWIGIASYVVMPGFPQYVNAITLSGNWPYATFTTANGIEVLPADQIFDVDVYEIGVGLVVGELTAASDYSVSISSGRTFAAHWDALPSGKANGDPITDAAHVAQDILLRDLGLDQATEIGAGYDTVPSYPARVALVEQEDSARVLARMCREFNWVGGHDNAGKETLVPWLSRLYSASSDYSVANADIVENSIDGIDATSVDDVATLPRVSSDWTQKDGFRQSGTVTDCTALPSMLTASNYLQYISGFGDFSTALDSYSVLHEAWKRNGIRQSEDIEYRYGGNPTDLLVPARLEWAASRKDILPFRLSEEHAAASAYVGQRIDITHKRYTGGGTAYGTLVARYWYPEDGQIQLTVMLDPVEVVIENQLYIDTIDASGATPLYIDQIDGVTGLYIDQTGA